MRKHLPVAALLLLLVALLPTRLVNPLQCVDLAKGLQGSSWHTSIDQISNAYYLWRLEPLVALINIFAPTQATQLSWIYLLFLFGAGLYFLLLTCSVKPWTAFSATAATALLIAFVFGPDLTLLATLCWSSWLTLVFVQLLSKDELTFGRVICLLSAAFLVSRSANQLAPLVILFAYLLAASIVASATKATPAQRAIYLGLPLALVMLDLALRPQLPFPAYPDYAHLVPDDGLPGIIRPLIGPATNIPVIYRQALKAAYLPIANAAAIAAALVLMIASLAGRTPARLGFLGLALAAAVWIDVALPESLSQIGPLAAASRVLPGLFLVPANSLVLACAVISTLLAAIWSGRLRWLVPSAVLIFLGAHIALAFARGLEPSLLSPLTARESCFNSEPQVLPAAAEPRARDILASPSRYLARVAGLERLRRAQAVERSMFQHIDSGDVQLSTASDAHPDELAALVDNRNDQNRWSSGQGKQTGREWLLLDFNAPRRIGGLRLALGKFVSDFPRGLRISSSAECSSQTVSSQLSDKPQALPLGFEMVSEQANWQGEINFSSDGFPYFGGQSNVSVVFPVDVTSKCLLVQQTGEESGFDWSVTEILLLPGLG